MNPPQEKWLTVERYIVDQLIGPDEALAAATA